MAKSVSITIRMDETLKKDFEVVLDDIGLSLSSAVTVFAKAVSKKHKIPFDLEADSYDEKEILRRLDDLEHGRNVVYKSLEDLKEMEK